MVVTKLTYLTVFSILYMIALICIYFSKQRINTGENYIYRRMIVANLIGLFLQSASAFCSYNYDYLSPILCQFIFKSYIIYYVVFAMLILGYVFILLRPNNKKILNITFWLYSFLCIIIYFLPIKLHLDTVNQSVYVYGAASTYSYIISGITAGIVITALLLNFKKISNRKMVPLFVYLVLCTVAIVIQKITPDVMIMCVVESFICFLMFHTIENPDMQMMEELYKNRKLIESSNQDTSNFLFKVSQEIKSPVDEIISKTDDNKNELIQDINNIGKHLKYVIEDILDSSSMTTKNIKLYTDKYNPTNIFNEVKTKAEGSLPNDVKLEYKVSKNIPEYVYGDSIKLKQILWEVLLNAISHTKEGYITFEVNTIIKYDICRFVIDVSDTGEGMPIEKVNEVLSLKENTEANDYDEKLNLKDIKSLVGRIGGIFMIKSDKDTGTTISITIDQKIVSSENSEISKRLDIYEESLRMGKKIMIIDDDTSELNRINQMFENKGAIVTTSLFGKDIIERVKRKYHYDLIIIKDELKDISAFEVLKELKKNTNFKTPVIIIIDDKKEFIKLDLLKDGFADVILKSKLVDEIDRVFSLYK